QDEHRKGVEQKAPDHAEGVGLAQEHHVSAAGDDGEYLQSDDDVKDAISRPVLRMRPLQAVGKHAVFGHAVQYAVGTDDGRIHGSRQNQEASGHDHGVEEDPQRSRSDDMHRQPPQKVVGVVFHTDFVGNDQHRQKGNSGGHDQTVGEDYEGGLFEILQFWRFDLTIDLGHRLFAAHRQNRVPEGQDQTENPDEAQGAVDLTKSRGKSGTHSRQKAERVFLMM